MPTTERKRSWSFLPIAFLFWTCVIVVDVIGDLSAVYARGEAPVKPAMLRMWLYFWGPWVLVSGFALRWWVHLRWTPGNRTRWFVRHVVLGLGVVAIHLSLSAALFQTFATDGLSWYERVLSYALGLGHRDLALYAGLVAVVTAWTLWLDTVAAELHSARVEADARQAKLEALRSQLGPHFLFNALNSVGALVRRGDREEALEALDRLGQLLRAGFDPSEPVLIPLKTELDRVRRYLDLERIRFRDRLRVQWSVEPSLTNQLVPALVLQPLVENAIKHGLAPSMSPVCIEVGARRTVDGHVELTVWNETPDEVGRGAGVGLKNTRDRLALLYQGAASLHLSGGPAGGVLATMCIPTLRALEGVAHA